MEVNRHPERGVWNTSFATKWEEAMVSGNGKQGVMVFGHPHQETIIGNHCRLYLPKDESQFVPDLSPYLSKLREIIQKEGYEVATKWYYKLAIDLGYPGLTMSDPFHPAFQMNILTDVSNVYHYARSTNFTNGEILVQFNDQNNILHQRKTFVSRADDIIVHSIENSSNVVTCSIEMLAENHPFIKQTRDLQKNTIYLCNDYLYSKGGYQVAIRIEAPGANIEVKNEQLIIHHAKKVLFIMKIEPFQSSDEKALIDLKHLHLMHANYEQLLSRHQKLHDDIFSRVTLTLAEEKDRQRPVESLIQETKETNVIPPVLLEKMYDAGRYMFICSAGELSPNLQGIWTGTYEPAWSGDFTFDTNVQLSIASALSCNLWEGINGFFRMVQEFLPAFSENAKRYYGCRGLFVAAHASRSGMHVHWNDQWPLQFWTCGAGWLGHWFYQYYLHTGDRDFLANQVIPYLEACALFYEDFLIKDEDGKYRFSPSYSAENGCGDNATQDIAVAKEILTNLIQAYQELSGDEQDTAKWERMLVKLPPYLINHDGALKEWAIEHKEEQYNHRHFSHLYPIFQSREFTEESEPKYWEAAKIAFAKRVDAWLLNPDADTTSTHGKMHAALCATQFGDRDLIYDIFQMMIQHDAMYPTLMTSHYHHQEVFNVDGNGAIPQIINEMIIDGTPGRITILQALPRQLDRGRIAGISLPKQIKVNWLIWDLTMKTVSIDLQSAIHQDVLLEVPLFKKVNMETAGDCLLAIEHNKWKLNLLANQPTCIKITLS